MFGPHTWFVLSLGAAILWGFGYAMSERLLHQGLSPGFLLVVMSAVTFPLYLMVAYFNGNLQTGLEIIGHNRTALFLALLVGLCIVVGNFLIFTSISLKNATLATMIEISYPLFTFLFAWLLFKDVQLNIHTAIGGLLILSGIGIIFLKN